FASRGQSLTRTDVLGVSFALDLGPRPLQKWEWQTFLAAAIASLLRKVPQPREAEGLLRGATPLGFEPRITPPKGAVLPLHHGVKSAGRFTIFDGATEVATRGTKNSKSRRERSPLAGLRQPGAVALQSKSGRRCYSLGFGRRMSTVVPLP